MYEMLGGHYKTPANIITRKPRSSDKLFCGYFVHVTRSGAKSKPKPAARKRQPKGHQLPEHFPEGTILTDTAKKQWQLGKSIGVGGFGEIYLAANDTSQPVSSEADFVVKIEPHTNGPLFVELHFYHRAGRPDMIQKWKDSKKMKHLGMPSLIAFGNHQTPRDKYRFLVLDRLSTDLQKTFEACNKKFSLKTAFNLGIQMLDVLEYLHEHDYVHADIKAGNILLGRNTSKSSADHVYLVDFGLAYRYIPEGVHKAYEADRSKAHDGTIEFTSTDAHMGARPSRRGDIEILGYCILQWLCGRLPWEDNLEDKEYVKNQKIKYMSNISSLMAKCFPKGKCPDGLLKYLEHVNKLGYTDKPDYAYLRKILKAEIKKGGFVDDGKLDFKLFTSPKVSAAAARKMKSPRIASPAVNKGRKAPAQSKRKPKDSSTTEDSDDDYTPPPKKKMAKSVMANQARRNAKMQEVVSFSSSDDNVKNSPVKKAVRSKQVKSVAANGVKSPKVSQSEVKSSQQRSTPASSSRSRKRKSESPVDSLLPSPRKKLVRSPLAESSPIEDGDMQRSPAQPQKPKSKGYIATIWNYFSGEC
ncbi:serine/threonine-protein kinase VRK1-like isoform X2 [Ptychodera flava]|uniref:serine/threonine-protein kinase VRK1-like isoform X2 n=1 Tax=Ptychodera flava TaxID=63121 RepID=UPI003969DA40